MGEDGQDDEGYAFPWGGGGAYESTPQDGAGGRVRKPAAGSDGGDGQVSRATGAHRGKAARISGIQKKRQ